MPQKSPVTKNKLTPPTNSEMSVCLFARLPICLPVCVSICQVWRGFLGRRAAADKRQRVQAATVLQRRLRGAQVIG